MLMFSTVALKESSFFNIIDCAYKCEMNLKWGKLIWISLNCCKRALLQSLLCKNALFISYFLFFSNYLHGDWLQKFWLTFYNKGLPIKIPFSTSFARGGLISAFSIFSGAEEHPTGSHFSLFVLVGRRMPFSDLSWSGLSEDSWCKATDGWGETMRVSRSVTPS